MSSFGQMIGRKYEKGERRYKHVGTSSEPYFQFNKWSPKESVGKCPNTLSAADREQLLSEAIPGTNGDRDLRPPKKLYVVDKGAIYEAQTSDHGQSYHGYPYRGKLSLKLLSQLRLMAGQKNCSTEFEHWVKKYIRAEGIGL